MATLDELVQEVVAVVPEVRGIQETVKKWVRRAVRRIDRGAVWRWLVEKRSGTFAGGEKTVELQDVVRVLDFSIDGRQLVFVHDKHMLWGVPFLGRLTEPALFSWHNNSVVWIPEVEAEAGQKWEAVVQKESGDVDAGENWWLNNRPDLVKARVLMECGLYLKSGELLETFTKDYEILFEEVKGGL